LKEKQMPKMKKRSYLKLGLGVFILMGLIASVVVMKGMFNPFEKDNLPEKQEKMVSVKIIDVPYKGQIFENEKAEPLENSTFEVKKEADPLQVKTIEASLPSQPQEPLDSEEISDESLAASEKNKFSSPPSGLQDKLTTIVASLDNLQLKATAAAAEPPKIELQDSEPQPLIKKLTPAKKGPFTVQVGVFRNERYANRKADKLKTLNYPAFIHEIVGKDQQTLYLVCFGHFMTREKTILAVTEFKAKENMDAVAALLK
jgi:cell division septation protein DedD